MADGTHESPPPSQMNPEQRPKGSPPVNGQPRGNGAGVRTRPRRARPSVRPHPPPTAATARPVRSACCGVLRPEQPERKNQRPCCRPLPESHLPWCRAPRGSGRQAPSPAWHYWADWRTSTGERGQAHSSETCKTGHTARGRPRRASQSPARRRRPAQRCWEQGPSRAAFPSPRRFPSQCPQGCRNTGAARQRAETERAPVCRRSSEERKSRCGLSFELTRTEQEGQTGNGSPGDREGAAFPRREAAAAQNRLGK